MTKIHCEYTELQDPDKLIGHPKNPNEHSEEQIRLLAKIIDHQGFRNPIVVSKRSGFIVAGHARLKAALSLQLKEVPVDLQDFEKGQCMILCWVGVVPELDMNDSNDQGPENIDKRI